MKHLLAITVLIVTAPICLSDDHSSERYIVATRASSTTRVMKRVPFGRDITRFRSVDGFAGSFTRDELRALQNDPEVLFIEKDPPRYLFDVGFGNDGVRNPIASRSSVQTTSAPAQQTPYGIDSINLTRVWKHTKGAGIKVGVVDTGIDPTHPDLEANVKGGISFLPSNESWEDERSHGTHVAGTIGSLDNDFGVVGVAPEVDLYSLRVFSASGDFTNASALIEAIDWSLANGIHILNMSLGGPDFSTLERIAFEKAEAEGLIIVAAAGNTGDGVVQYPAAYAGVIGVGAINSSFQIAGFSTMGTFVDVSAPGVSVQSTIPLSDDGGVTISTSDGNSFPGSFMTFSPVAYLSGTWVECGIGKPGEFPAEVSGQIALIERGELTFANKAKNAVAAGAVGVIIYNNLRGGFAGTLAGDGFAYPPTLSISREDGQLMRSSPAGTTVAMEGFPYGFLSGTSMASPHVAGATALLLALAPNTTPLQMSEALRNSAFDLGDPGYDVQFGAGLIDVDKATMILAPHLFFERRRPARR